MLYADEFSRFCVTIVVLDINKKLEKLEITFKQEEVEEVKNLLKEEKQLNARLREELEKERASETLVE